MCKSAPTSKTSKKYKAVYASESNDRNIKEVENMNLCKTIISTFPDVVSLQGRLVNELQISFGTAPAVAQAISNVAEEIYKTEGCELTVPGTILYSATHVSEPSGKPLISCKRVLVKLNLWEASDNNLKSKDRKKTVFKRIVTQAYDQEGVLTIEDCQRILLSSKRALVNYLAEYKSKGINLPLRGYVHSTGRGQTHKTEIICFYLEGMDFYDIQQRTYHSPEAISRYLTYFSRIVICHAKQHMKKEDIARVVNVSCELVSEYLRIFEIYSDKEKDRLDLILNPAEFERFVLPLKKNKVLL